MNNIQQERHLNGSAFDVIVKISKRKDREKPYNYYHWQDYYELIYVLRGEAKLILEGQAETSVKVLPIEPRAFRELGIVVRSRRETKSVVQALIQCAARTVAAME